MLENKILLRPILSGIISILGILIFSSFILSLLLQFTTITEASVHWFILPITLITLFIGGFIAGQRSGQRGWYVGALTGLAYLVLIWLITFLGFDSTLSLKNMIYYALYLILAIVGGMVGVNMSPKRYN